MALQLEVVTPSGIMLDETVDQVALPGSEGEFGVLPGHIPFLSALKPGIATIHSGGKEIKIAVSKGYAQVSWKGVVVLAEAGCRPEEVDKQSVEAELEDIQSKLASLGESRLQADGKIPAEVRSLEDAVQWALARLRLINTKK